jgi:hypothetical protein
MMKNPFFKSINKLKGKALDARMNKKDAIANKVGDALATVARKVGFINPKAEGTSPYEFGVDTAHKMMDLVGYKKGGKVTRRKKQVIKQKQNVTQKVVINMPKSRRRKTTGSKSSSKTQAPVAGYTGYLPVSKKPDTDEWQKLNKSSVTVEDVTEKLQPKMIEFAKQLRLEQAKDSDAMKQLIYQGGEQINRAISHLASSRKPTTANRSSIEALINPAGVDDASAQEPSKSQAKPKMTKTEAAANARAVRAANKAAKKAAPQSQAASQTEKDIQEALGQEESKIEQEIKRSIPREYPPAENIFHNLD